MPPISTECSNLRRGTLNARPMAASTDCDGEGRFTSGRSGSFAQGAIRQEAVPEKADLIVVGRCLSVYEACQTPRFAHHWLCVLHRHVYHRCTFLEQIRATVVHCERCQASSRNYGIFRRGRSGLRQPVFRVSQDPIYHETFHEEDPGGRSHLDTFRHPDPVIDARLLHRNV